MKIKIIISGSINNSLENLDNFYKYKHNKLSNLRKMLKRR
jgi:hypothetical protein